MANINASIVDQKVIGIVERHDDLLPPGRDENKKKSAAFTLFCMATLLDISFEEAGELLTEGGQDAGVDGLHLSDVEDGEFTITLFQGKYKVKDLTGNTNFPGNAVKQMINTVNTIFNPYKEVDLNDRIKPKVEEIRSLVRDYIPNVKIVLCNNGQIWAKSAQKVLDNVRESYGDQVAWTHFNHNDIVSILQRKKEVDAAVQLHGKIAVEEFDYRRVLIGKVPVTEIKRLFDEHGDLILERNIRRYLGLHTSRVNRAIHDTLEDSEKRDNFYFYNNGLTMICNKFRYNALQEKHYSLQVEGMQIINGGQTCKTIQKALAQTKMFEEYDKVFVLLRLYELAKEDKEFIQDITYATNSQNPVDLRDLRSNDNIQKTLEQSAKDLGYIYKRLREEKVSGPEVVTSAVAAAAVLSVWRKRPHQGKFRVKEHFGKLYREIFGQNLNASQMIIAVLIFRHVENERKRPSIESPPDYLPYASHFIAMIMGKHLLEKKKIKSPQNINHRNFDKLKEYLENKGGDLYKKSLEELDQAIQDLYGGRRDISLQQLSATFRRGDLLAQLKG